MMLIALKEDPPEITWTAGQMVMGDSRWHCQNNAFKPDTDSIYAKVTAVNRKRDLLIELQTSEAE